MKYAPLILRNLLRNRRRTLLTALAIGLAIFTYTSLSSLPYVISHVVTTPRSARRIVSINQAGFFFLLPESYERKIASIRGVVAVSGIAYFGGIYHSPSDQLGVAVDADAVEAIWPDWGITSTRAKEFAFSRTACLVPPPMLHKYGWRIGQTIVLKGTVYPVELSLHIVDTLASGAPADTLLFRRDYLDEVLGETGRINAYYILVDRPENVPAVIAAIDETFANSSAETRSASEKEFVGSFFDLRTLIIALKTFAAVAIGAMSVVALNTMAMAVRERRAEFAVMRALGFSSSLIAELLVAESLVIGLCGGVAGSALAYAVARVLPFSIAALGPVDLFEILPLQLLARAMAISALIGTAAGMLCLASLFRRSVAESMRESV
jgi:putative ABC transport system permease protein